MRQSSHHQRGVEADGGEHIAHQLLALLGILDAGNHQRLGDDVTDATPRIERGDRVLEDELHALAHLAQGLAMHRGQVVAVEQYLARLRLAQLQHRAAERGLAATGLADEAQRFAARDVETDVGHGMDDLAAHDIFDDKVFDLEQGIGRRGLQHHMHHAPTWTAPAIGWKQAY